jgi:hypothetical protein
MSAGFKYPPDFGKRLAEIKNVGRDQVGSRFEFVKFSKKQKQALSWWKGKRQYEGVIADGAVRSGKTVALSLGFILWAMANFSGGDFAVCGRTQGTVRRNVISPLRRMLPECGVSYSEKRSDNLLTVSAGGRSNRFYIFGAKDERAQDLIQGMTLSGVLFDEVALMPQSFVSQATARCSVAGSKFWFSCNPEGPHHWFKCEWIDKAASRGMLYLHFTMEDNLSLSDSVRQRYRNMYSGVFFRRYILGEWCVAKGLIYSMFSEERNVVSRIENVQRRFLSCDYGTNNPFALGLIEVGVKAGEREDGNCGDYGNGNGSGNGSGSENGNVSGNKNSNGSGSNHGNSGNSSTADSEAGGVCYHLAKEFYHDGRKHGQMTDGEYADALERFAEGTGAEFVIIDPSASSFIAELRKRGLKVIKAKNSVMDGIRAVSELLLAGLLTVSPSCECTLREVSEYMWDSSAEGKGEDKPLKQNDHAMDMLRYAVFTDLKHSPTRRGSFSGKGIM